MIRRETPYLKIYGKAFSPILIVTFKMIHQAAAQPGEEIDCSLHIITHQYRWRADHRETGHAEGRLGGRGRA